MSLGDSVPDDERGKCPSLYIGETKLLKGFGHNLGVSLVRLKFRMREVRIRDDGRTYILHDITVCLYHKNQLTTNLSEHKVITSFVSNMKTIVSTVIAKHVVLVSCI